MATLSVPAEYGYVLLWMIYTLIAYQYMGVKVSQARKKYGVKYPDLYADHRNENATAFNCIQRGHQNSLEFLPFLLAFVLVPAVRYPIVSAIAGTVMTTGRISYFSGYATGDPKKRMNGAYMYSGLLCQLVTTIAFAVDLLRNAASE